MLQKDACPIFFVWPDGRSELAREVEADVLESLLRHLQHIARLGQENVAAPLVFGHVLLLALLEVVELGGVVAFDPAGLVEGP